MKKGLILINAYSRLQSSLNQSSRLKEELESLGVSIDIKRNNYFECVIADSEIKAMGDYDFVIYLDKDKYVSEMLEGVGIRLFNSHQAIVDCDDKMCTYIRLAGRNINIVDTMPGLLCYNENEKVEDTTIDAIENRLAYPLIVKECYGSLGKGVYKCDNRAELRDIMEKLKMIPHLFQRYEANSSGMDIRVIVIGGKCIAAMVRKSDVDFRSNIELGGRGIAIDITPSIEAISTKVVRALNLDYAGIDLLLDGREVPYDKGNKNLIKVDGKYIDATHLKVCEVNSNAFFGGIESATHVNVARAYAEYIVDEIYVDKAELLDNVNYISISNVAKDRCNKKLGTAYREEEIIAILKAMILDEKARIIRSGKNWYVSLGDTSFTVNGSSYMVITADKLESK